MTMTLSSLISRADASPAPVWVGDSDGARDEGFAAVDALVALTIFSVTLILALQAGDVARRSAVATAETREAEGLLRRLVDAAPRRAEARLGRAGGFAWRVETALDSPDPVAVALKLCTVSAEVRSLKSGRVRRLSTVDVCPLVEVRR